MLKKLLFTILSSSVGLFAAIQSYSSIGDNNAKASIKAPLQNIFQTHEMDLFLKEFKMSLHFGICCGNGEQGNASSLVTDALTCRIGFKAHMIEPIGYLESTQIPLYFPFANIMIKSNPIKGNTTFDSYGKSAAVRGQNYPAHFIYFPLYGMILGKKLRFVCFHSGDLTFPYLSEFDPTWRNDTYYSKLVGFNTMMFSPSGLFTNIFDCVASEIANVTHGYSSMGNNPTFNQNFLDASQGNYDSQSFKEKDTNPSVTESSADMIRDTMYYSVGCQGFATIGGYVQGNDPIADLSLLGHTIIGLLQSASALSPKEFLQKQSNAIFNSAAVPNSVPPGAKQLTDTMCSPKRYPLPIASQYVFQLAYPTVGGAKEIGVVPAEYSTMKNRPGGAGSAVYVVWDRRDYYAFAYVCPGGKDDDKN